MEIREFTSSAGNKYQLKPLTFGELCELQAKAVIYDEKAQMDRMDSRKGRVLRIQAILVEPKLSEEQIEALPEQEGAELETATRRINTLPLASSPKPSSDTKKRKSQKAA